MSRALLYGATGYTGRAIAAALAGELDLVLAGRSEPAVRAVAEPLGLPWRAFALDDPLAVRAGLAGIDAVLHAAGPFAATAMPMLDACLTGGVHYIDLGGEWRIIEALFARDAEARAAGIAVLPGAALTPAATDCLLLAAVQRWPDTRTLKLGVSAAQVVSRGSVATMAGLADPGTVIRRGGALAMVPAGSLTAMFDFGTGPQETVATDWASVVTGGALTGVPDIAIYSAMHWSMRAGYRASGIGMGLAGPALFRTAGAAMARVWPEQPDEARRDAARFTMVAEAHDPWRRVRRLAMETLDGYGASVRIACAALHRVLAGSAPAGVSSLAAAFGSGFAVEAGAARFLADDRSTAA
ncbi:saccharopine dehydrogenase [Novosphingobium sediminis]|uniref:Saccharopine dehydrogenase n=1 Tax=Novosphingobium sediminis TaxID=707214 RepID=A0A512AMC9_9SPHN|nr:saccharopine dehydrogenase NADP-binding domain-containing protein [Novosphingobium sediminis]GEO00873.1 saccharopine dehydrogenase [Novosphingobium sediminis]